MESAQSDARTVDADATVKFRWVATGLTRTTGDHTPGTVGRSADSRKLVNKSALYGAGLGLLPFRFAAPAVAAVGVKLLKDVRDVYGAETTPVEQVVAAAVLGAGEFGLTRSTRAARMVPWVGPVMSAAMTGAAIKVLGEAAIAYYQWARDASEVDARPATDAENVNTRVTF